MADIADILMGRFTLIGEAVRHVPDRLLWRMGGYSYHDGLRVNGYHDGGTFIDFRRKNDEKAALWATNIRAVPEIRGETESEAVPNGNPYTQWAEEGYFHNVKVRTPEVLLKQILERAICPTITTCWTTLTPPISLKP